MKLGVICDGISRDLAHSVDVMDEFDLEYAELQFVGEKEVGDHSKTEIKDPEKLIPKLIYKQIKICDKQTAFLEAIQLAGFKEKEARKIFQVPKYQKLQ